MSTQQTHQQPEPGATFERLVEKLVDEPSLCAWCFAQRRRLHKEFDKARDDYVRHSTLQVITATSSPDPNTYSEVVPPKMRDGEPWLIEEPARPRCICGDCSNIDIDLHKHRSNKMLEKAARNMVRWLNKEHDRDLNESAAVERVRDLTSSGCAGRDQKTLAAALRAGFHRDG